MIQIKICGLRRREDIEGVNQLDINDAGFVFAKSPRQIEEAQAKELRQMLRPDITSVGVFVNEEPERIVKLVQQGIIQKVQLHGDEDKAYIQKLKKEITCPVIKAVRVRDDRESVVCAEKIGADMLLLDTYIPGQRGGSGQTFDLKMVPELTLPWYMAGGLTPENISFRLEEIIPYGVDISSGVETDGYKDINKVKKFVKEVRNFEKGLRRGEQG
ncbi:MAG: phosphoribosylanthranilate isomerase [Clostridia bacterium]|nr:phosphoribosylanthranilate isomerase [Lachnospiraceae bacterium]NCB99757.1 phosphoribosylanthranilate isomerase [Clostridia bacterium]NCD03884.1 phosphoribosylanthranilate isomerase [Clostridia bacterium]